MPKYYKKIVDRSQLNTRAGTEVVVPAKFGELSSLIICRCSFLQSLIQSVIYATHGPELLGAKTALKDIPSPKARMEFLSTFPYSKADPVVSSVFDFARDLFKDIYELRNVLAHEDWRTSDDFKDVVLFSSLGEEAKLSLASGRLLHEQATTPQQVYEATIRYIESVKIVSVGDLEEALRDANLCSWILMQVRHVLDGSEPEKKDKMREAFLIFSGTSHLFEPATSLSEKVEVRTIKKKTIGG